MSDSRRTTVTVLLVADAIGAEADMAHVAIDGTNAAIAIPATRIAEDAGISVNELPGRRFGALLTVGELVEELSDFRLIDDPRI